MYTKTAGNEHQINLNSNLESRNIKGKMSIVSKCIRERVLQIFFLSDISFDSEMCVCKKMYL